MRSSISLSKIKKDKFCIFLFFVIVFVVGGSYVHFLLYAPTAEDISGNVKHYEYFASRAKAIESGDIGLVAGTCLGRRIIHRCNVPNEVKLIDYSTDNLTTAKRIIIFEDTSFHLLYGRIQAIKSKSGEPFLEAQFNNQNKIKNGSKPFQSFAKYIKAQRALKLLDRKNKSKELQVITLREILLSPRLLRQFFSEHAAYHGTKILPLRVYSTKVWTEFFERYKKYFKRDFDTQQFYLAWQDHRQNFIFPKLRRRLQKAFITADSFKTVLPGSPDDRPCLDLAKGASLPASPMEYDLYPRLKRLVAAHNNKVKVSIVFLPYNPKFEMLCKEKFKVFYQALQSIAIHYGWPVFDFRSEEDSELSQYKIFRDRVHFWTDDYHPFFDIMAKKIGSTHDFPTMPCIGK